MKRFLGWLTGRLGNSPDAEAHRPTPTPVRVRPKPVKSATVAPQDVSFSARVDGSIADGGPGKNVLVRTKMVREDTGTHEKLQIVDDALARLNDDGGIDPYNTGRFDRAKSWDFPHSRN